MYGKFWFLASIFKCIFCFILEWQKWTGLFLQSKRRKKCPNTLSLDRHESMREPYRRIRSSTVVSKTKTAFDGCMVIFFRCLKPGQEEHCLLRFLKACLNTFVLASTLFQMFTKSANNMFQQILRTKPQGLRLKAKTQSCLLVCWHELSHSWGLSSAPKWNAGAITPVDCRAASACNIPVICTYI